MTHEAFDQIVNSARRGDVFAQAVFGKMLCEGNAIQKNLEHHLSLCGMMKMLWLIE